VLQPDSTDAEGDDPGGDVPNPGQTGENSKGQRHSEGSPGREGAKDPLLLGGLHSLDDAGESFATTHI